eukprot:scpid49501/ scgid20630/ Solute carrier family 2, facilitated glucose transporter member 4; GT2; Glucose transporter type 4, insulin-responsive
MSDGGFCETRLVGDDDIQKTGPVNHQGRDVSQTSLDRAEGQHVSLDLTGGDEVKDHGKTAATPQPKLNLVLCLAALASSIGSACQFGYAIGMLNVIRPIIISEFQDNTTCSVDFNANEDSTAESNTSFQWATAAMCVGGLFASIIAGPLSDRYGRRTVLLGNNLFAFIGGFMMVFAPSFDILIVGRVFQGISAGIGLVVIANYLGEIGPTALRGTMGASGQVLLSFFVFFATLVGLPQLFGTCKLWRVVLGGPILFATIQLAVLPFFPESPRFLFLTKNDPEATRAALLKLRDKDANVEAEIEELVAEKAAGSFAVNMSALEVLTSRNLRSRLFLIAIMHASQQLSGINGVFFYGSAIYSSAGLNNVAVISLIPGIAGVVFTFVSFKIVDRLGRRKMMIIGLAGLLFSHLLMTAGFGLNKRFFDGVKGSNWTSALTISGSLGVVVFFSLGPGPIPWLSVVELFPPSSLATGFVIAGVTNWTMNFLVGQFFLQILLELDPYGFLVFAGLAALFLVSIFFLLPETKGLPIEQVDSYFRQKVAKSSGCAIVIPVGDGNIRDHTAEAS